VSAPSSSFGRFAAPEAVRRLFIAVPVPDAVRLFVKDLVDRVRTGPVDAPENPRRTGRAAAEPRWVNLDGLHLTVRFLGATPEGRVDAVRGAVDTAAAGLAAFRVAIGGGGAFPSVERPRAIWLGVADPDGGMAHLAAAVARALTEAGWAAEDRPFTPHLTLARADGVRSGPRVARRLAAAADGLEAWFEVDRLVLYESHPGRGPASYERLHEAPLAT
jgi:2'-5' RNA ligase